MKDLIDNSEIEKVLAKLEAMEDEEKAVELLGEFNTATREYGQLLMNHDQNLDHEDWKEKCDKAKAKVDQVLLKINEME